MNITRLLQIMYVVALIMVFTDLNKPQNRSLRGTDNVQLFARIINILDDFDFFKNCTRLGPDISDSDHGSFRSILRIRIERRQNQTDLVPSKYLRRFCVIVNK